jgi:SAM-dependent methyltransferase
MKPPKDRRWPDSRPTRTSDGLGRPRPRLIGSQAAERNKEPIVEVLRRVLPEQGLILEVASGAGQHVVHFARAFRNLRWLPTEQDSEMLAMIAARLEAEALENVRDPLVLDASSWPWPVERADAVVCINMIHIAPWSAAAGLLGGSGRVLPCGGILYLYGPYRRFGAHTAPSNEAFDASLRARNPEWGVRDLEDVAALADRAGLELQDVIAMPANNLSVVFVRR